MIQAMWEQYRKYFIPTQVFILALCATLYFMQHPPIAALVSVLLMMELGAVGGAWWGARIKTRIENQSNKLPLDK